MTVDLIEVSVTFALPNWFGADPFPVINHVGEYLGMDSTHERALFALFPEMSECYTAPESKWVTFSFDPEDGGLPYVGRVNDLRLRLEAYLEAAAP